MGKVAEALTPNRATPCKMARIIAALSRDDRAAVEAHVAGYVAQGPVPPGVQHPFSPGRLERALAGGGYPITRSAIVKHIEGRCTCKRSVT